MTDRERPRSIVGQTSDDWLSESQWKLHCEDCEQCVSAAEMEACGCDPWRASA